MSTPVGVDFVLTKASSRASMVSERMRLPRPSKTGYDILAKTLNRTPFQAVGPMGCNVFRCSVNCVRHWEISGIRPKVAKYIIGVAGKQQVKVWSICLKEHRRPGRASIGCCPRTIGVVSVVFYHPVQRDMFGDLNFSR